MKISRSLRKIISICSLIILFSSVFTLLSSGSISIEQVGVIEFDDYVFDVALDGDYAYIGHGGNNLVYTVDISDPENAELVANFSINLPHYFEVKNGIAYFTTWNEGFQIYNVTDPMNPEKLGEFEGSIVGACGIYENIVFVGNGDGFNILDVSNPSDPVNLSRVDCIGYAHNFFMEENYSYVLIWNNTSSTSILEIYEYSDPSAPQLVSRYDTTKSCYDVKVQDNFVYLAGRYEGLSIIDVSDLSNPILVSEYDEYEESMALVIIEDSVFVGNGFAGLQIFDVSDKTSPMLIAEYETEGYAEELEIRNEYIFLATEGVGLEILKVKGLGLEESAGFPIFINIAVLLTLTSVFTLRKRKR